MRTFQYKMKAGVGACFFLHLISTIENEARFICFTIVNENFRCMKLPIDKHIMNSVQCVS